MLVTGYRVIPGDTPRGDQAGKTVSLLGLGNKVQEHPSTGLLLESSDGARGMLIFWGRG